MTSYVILAEVFVEKNYGKHIKV